MKETGMIFSTDMVKAILDGTKTMTRRVIKPQPRFVGAFIKNGIFTYNSQDENAEPSNFITCPYGQVGDRLWLKHRYDLFDVYYKPIVGYEGLYYAGTDGHIYREGHQLKELPTSEKGYLCVSLSKSGDIRTQNVHRLICRTFYGQPHMADAQVRHMDGNPQNNNPSNLDWGTQMDNWFDRKYHGRGMGEEHFASKVTHSQAMDIRQSTKSQRQLAHIYNVSQPTIQAIKTERYWKDITLQPSRNIPAWAGWKSPLFMPRWASRIPLEITELRAERLQEISEEDAEAEGVEGATTDGGQTIVYKPTFADLWDSLNAERGYGWGFNPWVWPIGFRRL